MEWLRVIKLHVCLLVLACSCAVASAAIAGTAYEDKVVLTCNSGDAPDEFVYCLGAGLDLVPRCFAIDGNGGFIFPWADMKDNIRISRFDKSGKFISVSQVEGKSDVLSAIAVSPDGDIFLAQELLPSSHTPYRHALGHVLCHYDPQGKLLRRLGPDGKLTLEEWLGPDGKVVLEEPGVAEEVRMQSFSSIDNIFCLADGDVLVQEGYGDRATFSRFDPRDGHLVEKGAPPPASVAADRKKLEKMDKRFETARREEGKSPTGSDETIGPDGHFYYMRVKHLSTMSGRLEIHRVTFPDE